MEHMDLAAWAATPAEYKDISKGQLTVIRLRERGTTVVPVSVGGYDYERQAWVCEGRYVRCGHPDEMDCRCYGRLHEGELIGGGEQA